jgi:hypothetical protein
LTEIDAARQEDVNGVETMLFQLGDQLEGICGFVCLQVSKKTKNHPFLGVEKDLQYARGRQFSHHSTNESTHQRVLYWSVLEAVVVIAVAVFQVCCVADECCEIVYVGLIIVVRCKGLVVETLFRGTKGDLMTFA